MARRASSSQSPAVTFGIIGAVVLLLGAGYFFMNQKPKGFTSPPLPVESFLRNANSLRGNRYSMEGRVHSIEPRDDGKFVEVVVQEQGREQHLFVVVPTALNETNLEREQRFAFEVTIEKGGIPRATAMKRL
ncbi:MAG: hypothetical protein Q7Q71_04325 [Verrucomicrobiota bacterium JB023]|nr:hypothetical protein [Verrucomicrobiota bacterium JB023]